MRGANYHCIFLIAAFCIYRLWINFTAWIDVWEKRICKWCQTSTVQKNTKCSSLFHSLDTLLFDFKIDADLPSPSWMLKDFQSCKKAVMICLMRPLVDWLWLIVVAHHTPELPSPPSTLLWSKRGLEERLKNNQLGEAWLASHPVHYCTE